MYPLIRLLTISTKARFAPLSSCIDTSICSFRARPWDMDMFMEMNNGRHLTLFDLGRFDFAIKCGLTRVLRQQGWGLVVAGASVRFRKRIRIFNKVTMYTQLVGIDERWFYFHQAMFVGDTACSSALMRTAVTENGRTLQTHRVVDAMDASDAELLLPGWVQDWVDADHERPWPPVFET